MARMIIMIAKTFVVANDRLQINHWRMIMEENRMEAIHLREFVTTFSVWLTQLKP